MTSRSYPDRAHHAGDPVRAVIADPGSAACRGCGFGARGHGPTRITKRSDMIVIGVTGSVGTGKSTVARMFGELGAVVLDADAIARRLMEPGRPVWRQIVKSFGATMRDPDGALNRGRLASIVFRDERERRRLERIVHPHVLRSIRLRLSRLRRARDVRAVVLDVPLLIEVGAHHLADVLVVVTAPAATQRRRLEKTYGWSKQQIAARTAAQWDLSAKVALADYVIDNADGVGATQTQVKRIWNRLLRYSRPSSTSRR